VSDESTEESNVLEFRKPEPGAAPVIDDMADCDVHTDPDCDVHSTADDRDVHSNNVIDLTFKIAPTREAYPEFQLAYEYLNAHLFDNKLPNCLITLETYKGSYGYFVEDRYGRTDGQKTDQIAINPQHLDRKTEHVLSTLTHEMVHLCQHHFQHDFGKPGRGGYHNKQWADKMEEIGLIPSDTGKEGGKHTGDRMSHYIKLGGRFALVVEQLLATGFEFTWREIPPPRASSAGGSGNEEGGGASISGNEKGGRTPLSGKRTKFTCPHQGCQNAWAKPGASLMCAIHEEKMLPTG